MATLTLTLDKASYAVGEPIQARLVVSGADAENRVVNGTCVVDGVTLPATVTFVLQHSVTGQDVVGFTQDASDPFLFHGVAA